MKPHGTSTFLSRNNFISVTLTDSPPCPLTPSWSASVTPPPIYQDCSDRTHHIQTYPGIEINTSIATVGYYGGTSPGVVLVSAQHAILVR